MERIMKYDFAKGVFIACFTALAAWFDSTISFLVALMLGFLFNVMSGLRADEVKIKLTRLIPPSFSSNFQGNKFKDSLMELFLITAITYILKGIIDLMKYQDKSAYVVQFLLAVAIYFFFRNGLRNLKKAYPRVKFIALVYFLVSFEFRKLVSDDVAAEMDRIEEESNKKEDNETNN